MLLAGYFRKIGVQESTIQLVLGVIQASGILEPP